jgi:hypothetical protein
MWVVGNYNLPYVGQDTNAIIENYYGNLKATFHSSKGIFHGRRGDWVINELVGDVLVHIGTTPCEETMGLSLTKTRTICHQCTLEGDNDSRCMCHITHHQLWVGFNYIQEATTQKVLGS